MWNIAAPRNAEASNVTAPRDTFASPDHRQPS